MALIVPRSGGDLLQEIAMTELREVYSKINNENFLLFQTFEQSYQQYISSLEQAINDDAGVDFLNCFMATSENFQQHLSSLCQQISAIAERVAITPDEELPESLKESLLAHLERQYTMFQNLLQIWSLLEIFELSAASSSKHLAFDLIPWLTSSQYSTADCYEAFKAMTHPEHYEGDGQGQGFWQVVYDNALQGHVSAIVDLLKLHSEFSVHFLSSDAVKSKGVRRAVSKEHVSDFLHLLESFPYLQLLDTLMPQHTLNTTSTPPFQNFKEREEYLTHFLSIQHPNLVSEFQQWQESLQHYRDTSLLLTQIPELDFLVRLLQGERRAIEMQSKGQWHSHLLALLLYQFPCHQLTKINLKQMMEEVLDHYHHVSSVNTSTVSLSLAAPSIAELSLLYREVLRGNIGFILKIIYEASYITFDDISSTSSSSSPISSFGLVGKECAVTVLLQLTHVSRLLSLGAHLLELTTPLPHSMHHLSFFEEVVLETGEKLAQLHYPYDMLRGYLSLSPQYGSLFYRELLRRQPINSDDDCERVAEALRQAHFIEDSQRIFALRGNHWLHSPGNLSRLRDDVASNVKILGWHGVTSSTMPKAAHYYALAKENDVVVLIMETSLYRCMHAVVQCSDVYFRGMLHYQPGKPALPLRPGQPLPRAPSSSSASTSQRKSEGENEAEGEEELRRKVEYLDYALHEAEGIVNLLAPLLKDTTTFLYRQYSSLLHYSQAVTALLLPKSDPPNHSYRQAADNICQLLVPTPESVQPPNVSSRYWLHLLELSYFIHHLISSLELQQSLDHSFLHQLHTTSVEGSSEKKRKGEKASNSALAVLDDTMVVEDAPTSVSALTHYGQPVFSKAVIGQFHVILTLLEQQSDFLYLLHLCHPQGTSEEAEIRSQLKMNLISLLTSAYLVSSHFHFTSSNSSSTHLSATTFLDAVREKSKRDDDKTNPLKSDDVDREEEEEGGVTKWQYDDIAASYDLADILDGSAFL